MHGCFTGVVRFKGVTRKSLTTLIFPRAWCKLHRKFSLSSSEAQASDRSLLPLDLLFDLLKDFLNLHCPAFAIATISCIVMNGGPAAFDFRGHVMLFGLRHRNDNPGTAFSIGFADCVPVSTLYELFPVAKELLQAAEEEYNSEVDFNKATMENFGGLIKVVYQADQCILGQNVPIRDNPEDDAANCADWLLVLQNAVDNGVVGKALGNGCQLGKIIKQGSRWKWVPLPGLS